MTSRDDRCRCGHIRGWHDQPRRGCSGGLTSCDCTRFRAAVDLTALAAASTRRRAAANTALTRARRKIAFEDAVELSARWLNQMGVGHWPDVIPAPEEIAETLLRGDGSGREPRCRYCGVPSSSLRGSEPCRGDDRVCCTQIPDWLIQDGVSFQRYRVDSHLCGRPGAFIVDFTAWRCTEGHVTVRTAFGHPPAILCSACLDLGCLPHCPGLGLADVGHPAPSPTELREQLIQRVRDHLRPGRPAGTT